MNNYCLQKGKLEDLKNKNGIRDFQEYVQEILSIRELDNVGILEEMLMLCEEVGELAKAIRKNTTNMKIDQSRVGNYDTVESELADVAIILMGICNIMNIDLHDAVIKKEEKNIHRNWSS